MSVRFDLVGGGHEDEFAAPAEAGYAEREVRGAVAQGAQEGGHARPDVFGALAPREGDECCHGFDAGEAVCERGGVSEWECEFREEQ